jgi:hypothetical protein
MRHIENEARRELRAVRLDASADHEGYEERGLFQAYGTELVCYEKTVIPAS